MKPFTVQIEEIKAEINIRLENYREAVEKYHTERARLREVYFSEGFREDIAATKAEEETQKIRHKVEAISKELDKMVTVLQNIDIDRIKAEQSAIKRMYLVQESTIDDADRTKGVLIVDGTKLMRDSIHTALAAGKVKIIGEAENGRIAVEKYKELLPQLVIMDAAMPEMDGLEALKIIKDFDPGAKIIMCSQVTKQSTVDDAIRLGALNFIVKPFKPEKLLAIVKQTLGVK
jgi:two-component system chemotaxis response regulator CheY